MDIFTIIEYLKVLDLPRNQEITAEQVKANFRELCKVYHPDVAPKPFKDGKKFREIKEAQDYLLEHVEETNVLIRNNFKEPVKSTYAGQTSGTKAASQNAQSTPPKKPQGNTTNNGNSGYSSAKTTTSASSRKNSTSAGTNNTGSTKANSVNKTADASDRVVEDFANAAVTSAQIYWDYLAENHRGVTVCKVSRVVPDPEGNHQYLFFTLETHPKSQDALIVRINQQEISTEKARPVEYHLTRRTLKVKVTDETVLNKLKTISPTQIDVISDLKFLIKNLGSWYKRYGYGLKMPVKPYSVPAPDCHRLHRQASADQQNALDTCLRHPFTYVWGAPGTGKTQFVLARLVLAFIQADKHVLITAPTNNAVEQTLNGLLPELQEAGYDPGGLVMRLGVPSTDFAAKYPSVCEDASYAKVVAQLNAQIDQTKENIADEEKLLSELRQYVPIKKFYSSLSTLKILSEEDLSAIADDYDSAFTALDRSNEAIGRLKAEVVKLQKNIERNTEIRHNNQVLAKEYSKGLKHVLYPSKEAAYWKLADEAHEAIGKDTITLEDRQKRVNELCAERDRIASTTEKIKIRLQSEKQELFDRLTFWPEEKKIIQSEISGLFNPTDVADRHKKRVLKEKHDVGAELRKIENELNGSTEAGVKQRLEEYKQTLLSLEKKKNELVRKNAARNPLNCKVIAVTLDTMLNRVKPDGDFHFDHVFLDEAGYCSVIKAATLTAYNCPVTFLGDHMQLPPICEIGDEALKKDEYKPVALWAQSALYVSEALTEGPEVVCRSYNEYRTPTFAGMKKCDLIKTYRFGPKLANVLAGEVYSSSFYGTESHDTEIYYIHAPRMDGAEKRVNLGECRAIVEYVRAHRNENIAILAPYNNQVNAIKDALYAAGLPKNIVYTIHKSQGREWDTVLISVTDTANKYFTDSTRLDTNGKKLINTAVSRAKKKLVLVLDVTYWRTQKDQLIGKLLDAAELTGTGSDNAPKFQTNTVSTVKPKSNEAFWFM